MADINIFKLYLFADGVFANLNVAEAFGSKAVGPGDAGGVVVVDDSGARHDGSMEIEFFEDMIDKLKVFDALVSGSDRLAAR